MSRILFNLCAGDRVLIDRVHHLVLERMVPSGVGGPDEPDDFIFVDERVRRPVIYSQAAFLELYDSKRVRLLSPTERITDVAPQAEGDWRDDEVGHKRAAKALRTARRRLWWVQALDAEPVSLSTHALAEFIKRKSVEPGAPQPPSPGALRRWFGDRGVRCDRRLAEMAGRHQRGPKGPRLDDVLVALLEEAAEPYWEDITEGTKDVWVRLTHKVALHNQAEGLPAGDLLRRPAPSTVWQWLRRNLTFERACRRFGAQEAERRFGVVSGSMVAPRLLDIGVMDHFTVDCWLIDDETGQPIGRPRITLILDACTRYPLGYHLGWRDPSVEAVMACLRHAIRPKTYIRDRYPGIKHEWLAFGQPRTIVVDQGLEFRGTSFEDACATLGISIEMAPVRTPQFKGQIERVGQTLNRAVFQKSPGGVPFKPELMKRFGVDPEKTAVMLLSDANELVHKWIVDVYSREEHRSLGCSPAQAWLKHAKTDVIELARDVSVVDRACSKVVWRSLTREGIQLFSKLQYRSPEVPELRRQISGFAPRKGRGDSVEVKVSYHPEDLSEVYVWNPVTRRDVTLPSTAPKYTKGLTEGLHKRLQELKKAENKSFQTEAEMCAARVEFREWMQPIHQDKVRDRKRLQRLRQPEREAAQDSLLRVREIDDEFEVLGGATLVRTDTSAIREDAVRRERRPLMGKKKGRRTAPKQDSRETLLGSSDPAKVVSAGIDWAAAVAAARAQRTEIKIK